MLKKTRAYRSLCVICARKASLPFECRPLHAAPEPEAITTTTKSNPFSNAAERQTRCFSSVGLFNTNQIKTNNGNEKKAHTHHTLLHVTNISCRVVAVQMLVPHCRPFWRLHGSTRGDERRFPSRSKDPVPFHRAAADTIDTAKRPARNLPKRKKKQIKRKNDTTKERK